MEREQQIQALSDEYFDFFVETYPEIATSIGVHSYDGRLSSYDRASLDTRLRKLRQFQKRAERSLTSGGLSVSANYMFAGGNDDLYFELGYSFDSFDVFAGIGNEAYSLNEEFDLVNIGLSSLRDIKITDKYSLPVKGSLILNPDLEQIHIVFGLTF